MKEDGEGIVQSQGMESLQVDHNPYDIFGLESNGSTRASLELLCVRQKRLARCGIIVIVSVLFIKRIDTYEISSITISL